MGAELLALSFFAHPPVTVGDIDPAGYTRGSCGLNPYANDVIGGTDKLNSHSIHVGCGVSLRQLSTSPEAGPVTTAPAKESKETHPSDTGFYSGITWRLFTPIWADRHGAKSRQSPIGSYADWIEWQSAVAHTWQGFYGQASFSFHHIGPKGGAQVQQTTHELLGLRAAPWKNQPQEMLIGGSGESGLVWLAKTPTLSAWLTEARSGIGWSHSPLVQEPYVSLRLHGALPLSMQWHGALQVGWPSEGSLKLVPLPDDKLLQGTTRTSTSLTLRYPRYAFSSVTVTSPFVIGDRHRHLVLTPLGLVIDL